MASVAEELRGVEVFAALSDEQRGWLAAHGTIESYEDGGVVFALGGVADAMIAVLEGIVEIMTNVGGQQVPFFTTRRGEVSGLLPFSRMRTYMATASASGPTRIFRLHQRHFDEMLHVAPELGPRLVGLMSDRVRESTRLSQQREKMMALGKLAAGLAHELNNPAAAVRRDAERLRERVSRLPGMTGRLLTHEGLRDGWHAVTALAAASESNAPVSARTRAKQEDLLGGWLAERGVDESWVHAETFAGAGLTRDTLDRAAEALPQAAAADVLAWLADVLAARQLAEDIAAAASRMSELVGSVKVYSHLDRGGTRERVDIAAGLDSTLVMLGHRLKRGNVTLERAYAEHVPFVDGYAGELNQVWTNLIDNALDAMPDGGTLRIELEPDGSSVVVRVIDSGSGIPAEVQPRIFDAFFTTKPVGEGMGLGLDVVQRLVSQQHGGRIEVESRPGRTAFTIRLPGSHGA